MVATRGPGACDQAVLRFFIARLVERTVTDRVKNRLAVIDLDALHGVGSMAVNQIGAGVEREVRESLLIFLGHVLIARAV